jgi:hypothetical protein
MTAVTLPSPDTDTQPPSAPVSPARDRIDTALRVAVIGLVATVAAIAFVASFEAISQYAVRVGAFPAELWWAAPLLVDTFIVAGSLAALRRARVRQWAVYPWSLVAAGTAVSVTLNVAHAPPTLPARLVSALPSTALLASFELLLAEARRTGRYESVVLRTWRAWRRRRTDEPTPPTPPEEPAAVLEPPAVPASATEDGLVLAPSVPTRGGEARETVRRLLEELGPAVTRAQVREATGVGETRAGQLLREEKAKRNGSTP